MYQHRLNVLELRLEKSGIGDNPIISDDELRELYNGLLNIESYFRSTNPLISNDILNKIFNVQSVLRARGHNV